MAFIAATRRALPLAASSRRRRFLAAWLYHTAATLLPSGTAPSPEQDRRDSALALAGPTPLAPQASPRHEPAGGERLRRALEQQAPLTWMLAGESFDTVPSGVREWPSFTSRLTEAIRRHPVRGADVFIVETRSGPALARLAHELPPRAARFRPDVVLLSLSPRDVEQGLKGLETFERQLADLVEAVLSAGALPILCTPPCLEQTTAESTVDRSVYVEAIRATAAEYEVPLVDHWAEWELVLQEPAAASGATAGADRPPGPLGPARLAQRILEELGLSSPLDAAPLFAE